MSKDWEAINKKKLDLMNKYPLLYSDKNKSMQETCMCWGLEVGEGWLPMIDELSAKLEKEIQTYLEQNADSIACECGHSQDFHNSLLNCSYIYKMPVVKTTFFKSQVIPKQFFKKILIRSKIAVVWRLKNFFNKIVWWLTENTAIHKKEPCDCKKFYPSHPRASQVKEKYGGLRFYMTSSTDKMKEIISEYEALSETICDECGKPGDIKGGGWLVCNCDECYNKRNSK